MAEFTATIDDSVATTDQARRALSAHRRINETISAADLSRIAFNGLIEAEDEIEVFDLLTVTALIALRIDDARALTDVKVRVDFSSPAFINAALTNPANYHFDNLSPGSVEVVPLAIRLPSGQPSPRYVEIDTTEHTEGATYEVALSPALRGALDEIGSVVPFEYAGIGVKPTLQLVLAISPTEVEVHFSEAIANNAAANDPGNYQWAGGISTIDVRGVVGNVVSLQTTAQVPGQLYTLTVLAEPVAPLVSRTILSVPRISGPADFEVQVSEDDIVWVGASVTPSPTTIPHSGSRNPETEVVILVGDAGLFCRSTDGGLTFAYSTPFGATANLGACWYGNGLWIINYYDGAEEPNVSYSSDDGVSWSAGINPDDGTGTGPTGTAPAGASDVWYDGLYVADLGLHVAVGKVGAIWTSPDAINWTRQTADDDYVGAFPSFGFRGIAWSSVLGLLVAVGDNVNGEVQTSPDGIVWTQQSFAGAPGTMEIVFDVCWSPTLNLFVAVGGSSFDEPSIQTSPDGVTWTERTSAQTTGLSACAWDSVRELFVVGGRLGQVQTSPDGITWTARTLANPTGVGTIFVIIGGGEPAE